MIYRFYLIKIFPLKMYFTILRKYLSAYVVPIFKKANVINIPNTNKNKHTFNIIGRLSINKIPIEITLTIIYNICLNDK